LVKEADPQRYGGHVTVQVVDQSRTLDDRGGYYLSREVVALLAELRADLDIDVASGDLV
jgi:hypothetical protein